MEESGVEVRRKEWLSTRSCAPINRLHDYVIVLPVSYIVFFLSVQQRYFSPCKTVTCVSLDASTAIL